MQIHCFETARGRIVPFTGPVRPAADPDAEAALQEFLCALLGVDPAVAARWCRTPAAPLDPSRATRL